MTTTPEAERDEIESVLRQVKKAAYIGVHAGNYGLRHYLSHEQKLLVEAALLAALSRPAPTPAEFRLGKRPVAFRVQDKSGNWEIFADEEMVQNVADACGLVYQGLYVRDGTPLIDAPGDDLVTLLDCPIGLFLCGDELCLKTEYGNNEGRIDAYIVSSGEFFWGAAPQTIASQRKQLVRPVTLTNPSPDAGRVPERPNWAEIYRNCVHVPNRDQELVQITRETARLAVSALRRTNAEDYYHNSGAAERELVDAIAASPAHDEVKS